jgi:hypothetical protein
MAPRGGGYVAATRHPWPCLLFVLPLLAGYEAGVLLLGGPNPEAVRNGADHWLRVGFRVIGLRFFWVPPALLCVVFALWALRRRVDRPRDLQGVLSGMGLESVGYALGLWAISRLLPPLLTRAGIDLAVAPADPGLRQAVTYLGAGIYEEALFRLVLFSALVGLLRLLDLPRAAAVALAAAASATLFSAAHHVGPYGQPYGNYLFLFRLAAGVYFALLYQLRGFGIAVGAHACYNVMVSIT